MRELVTLQVGQAGVSDMRTDVRARSNLVNVCAERRRRSLLAADLARAPA